MRSLSVFVDATNQGFLDLTRFFHTGMTGEPQAKKQHMMVKIGTHNGTFHCDEVLACFLLKQLDQYKDAEIIRTRDQALLDTCDIVVDVGGVYDPSKHRYDHHQRSFVESMNSLRPEKKWVTKLSSAGLIYLHFGMDVLAKIMELSSSDAIVGVVYDKIYEGFLEEIDAIDNGINQWDGEPRYRISTNLSCRVGGLNAKWNEKGVDEMAQFEKAMKMVGEEFMDKVLFYKNTWLPARVVVEESMLSRFKVHSSGRIMLLGEGGVPWRDHLFALEEEQKICKPIIYVLYTDQNGNWRVQCVPATLGSFENRLSLLEEWRGLRDDVLSEKSGIKDCIFVHNSGFIGGNKTYEGALEMAERSLEQLKETQEKL